MKIEDRIEREIIEKHRYVLILEEEILNKLKEEISKDVKRYLECEDCQINIIKLRLTADIVVESSFVPIPLPLARHYEIEGEEQ
jgi:predicted transcriptional regulator